MVKNQKEHLEQMAEGQKRFFDQMLKVRKAEKKEFLNIWSAHLNVNQSAEQEPCNANDESLPPLMYNGFDLMTMYAPEKSSIFGRELCRRLFGKGKRCELVLLILGKHTTRDTCRQPCDEHRYNLFKGTLPQNEKFLSNKFSCL